MKRIISLLLCAVLIFSLCGCDAHFTEEGLKVVAATGMGTGFHTADPAAYSTSMKSGLYELLLDESNCAIAAKDTTGKIWYALPTAENSIGAMLNLEVTDGSKWYKLNSQDNAVALGGAKCITTEDSINISYTFKDKASNPSFSIPVTLTLKLVDGVFVASVDTSKIGTDWTIINVEVLPTFGAVTEPTGGDFIVIPDGPGALITLASAGENEYVLDTYGKDPAKFDEDSHPAVIGAFGLRSGSSAFAGVVTSGDAISKIKVSTGTLNTVGAAFSYPRGEVIQLSYKFISGSAATASTLASMCREQLTRDGMLSTRVIQAEDSLPVNITVNADRDNKFENTEDLISILKAKGIDDINLRYDNIIKNYKVQSKMGKSEELESLRAYLSSQGFGFYPTVNFFDGNVPTPTKLTSKVVSFMKDAKKLGFEGYCIGDVGSTLSSTSSAGRQDFAQGVFSQSIALSTNKSLMVDHGNLYTLKNANIISGLPIYTSYEECDYYEAVPFVQMILRGVVEYTGTYLNDAADYDQALLRCLEYGAMPSYVLSFNEDDEKTFYENWSARALAAYNLFDGALSDLRAAKMTDHKKIQNGLYLSVYNNETYIYINYTGDTQYYNGLTIGPLTYLRVN